MPRLQPTGTAPSLGDLDALARGAFASLPAEVRRACDGLLIRVADFAPEELLEEMEIEDPFELTGLYDGVALTEKSVFHQPTGPDTVWLYRRPILDYWAENEETLGDIVTHVLIHEIGHHFGMSDEDMERIEAAAE